MSGGDTVALMLSSTFTQVIVQRSDTTLKTIAVMVGGIQNGKDQCHAQP